MSFCRPSVSSAPSEKADSAVYITEKKPISAALQRPPSIFMSSVPGNLISLCVQKHVCFEWVRTQFYREHLHMHARVQTRTCTLCVCRLLIWWRVAYTAKCSPLHKKIKALTVSIPASSQCFAFLSQLWFGRSLSGVSGNYSRNMVFPCIASLLPFRPPPAL